MRNEGEIKIPINQQGVKILAWSLTFYNPPIFTYLCHYGYDREVGNETYEITDAGFEPKPSKPFDVWLTCYINKLS